jgi:hypothetical protein
MPFYDYSARQYSMRDIGQDTSTLTVAAMPRWMELTDLVQHGVARIMLAVINDEVRLHNLLSNPTAFPDESEVDALPWVRRILAALDLQREDLIGSFDVPQILQEAVLDWISVKERGVAFCHQKMDDFIELAETCDRLGRRIPWEPITLALLDEVEAEADWSGTDANTEAERDSS